jgi:hypothetical protein
MAILGIAAKGLKSVFSYGVKSVKWAGSGIKSGFAAERVVVEGGKTTKLGPGIFRQHPWSSLGAAGTAGLGAWATFGGDSEKTLSENMGAKASDVVTGAKDVAKDFGKGFVGGISEDDDVKDAAKAVGDAGKAAKETVEGAANRVGSAVSSLGDMLGGFVSTMSNVFGGVGNMLSSLTNGKVGGLGVVGLLASAYLIFGRTGILGKFGGLLMGMTLLSGIMRPSENVSAAQSVAQQRGKNDSIALAETAPQQPMRR